MDDALLRLYPNAGEFASQSFGIYPRVSTEAQAASDKVSIPAQIEACKEYGEGLGMTLDRDCVKWDAYSGTTNERPELRALIRTMIAHRIPNVVIDRVDRFGRGGQLAAAQLLQQFIDAGILLHVASMGLLVRDEFSVNLFLQMAFAAQQANKARIHALKRARRFYAEVEGRYYSGGNTPYGFNKVIDQRNDKGHPTKFHFEKDERVLGGYNPWEVRRDICRWYLAGMSGDAVARRLSAAKVPTSHQNLGWSNARAGWNHTTIYDILDDPINEGILTSLKQKTVMMPPDANHPTRWDKKVRIPFDEQIKIKGTWVARDAVILTHEEAERIRALRIRGRQDSPRNAKQALGAVFIGARARCGMPRLDNPALACGGTMRAKGETRPGKGATGSTYICSVHEHLPSRCAAKPIPVALVDQLAWRQVVRDLTTPGRLQALAEEQARLDTTDDPASHLAQLRRTRDTIERRRKSVRAVMEDLDPDDPNQRDERGYQKLRLTELNEQLTELDEQIAAAERLAADSEHRNTVLSNINYQVVRHQVHILELDVTRPDDIASIRAICRSLGTRPVVRWADRSRNLVDIEVNYDLSTVSSVAWFTGDSAGPDPMGDLRQKFADLNATRADAVLKELEWFAGQIQVALQEGWAPRGAEGLLQRIEEHTADTKELPQRIRELAAADTGSREALETALRIDAWEATNDKLFADVLRWLDFPPYHRPPRPAADYGAY